MWVACTDPWCGSQCWLKWIADPSKPTTRGSGATNPWTSGAIHKDVPTEQPVPSPVAKGRLGPARKAAPPQRGGSRWNWLARLGAQGSLCRWAASDTAGAVLTRRPGVAGPVPTPGQPQANPRRTPGAPQVHVPDPRTWTPQVPSEKALNATRVVALRTTAGDLRIRLKPEWHLPSVRFVQQAALGDFCTVKCELYRAEPGFLLQGAMRALVTPNTACRRFSGGPAECTDPKERPGGMVMAKGDVAWAGGSAGPDFFIAMSRIGGFGGTHTAPRRSKTWGGRGRGEGLPRPDRPVARPCPGRHPAAHRASPG